MLTEPVEAWLYRRLRTIPGLRALGSRIYPLVAPPGVAPPFSIYMRKSTGATMTLTGPLPYETSSFVVTVFASSYTGAKALAASARESLNGFVGFYAGVHILFVEISSEADTLVSADAGELLPFYGIELTVDIKHKAH